MSNPNKNKQTQTLSFQKIATALTSLGAQTLMLDGQTWKVSDLIAGVRNVVTLTAQTDAARSAWLKSATDEQNAVDAITPALVALRGYIGSTYGTTSKLFTTEFGYTARKVGRKSAASVAQSVEKNLATRKARNTLGKKQRLAIKGVVQPAAPTASVRSPAGTNGTSH